MRLTPYLLLVLFAFSACNSNKSNSDTTTKTSSPKTENVEKEQVKQVPGMLLGDFQVEELNKAPYNSWYTPTYERTVLDKERVAYLGTLLEDVEILGYVGSWCGDTKRELPNLLRILDELDFDDSKLTLIGTDRNYNAPDGSNEDWNIQSVPTFIFLKDNKELGRFIEFADESLLEDIIKILEQK